MSASVNRMQLLALFQHVKTSNTIDYRGRTLAIDKVMDAPPLLYITVGGWESAMSCNGQDTNHALEAIRDIDMLIDILDEREPTGFEDAAINPEMASHVTLRVNTRGAHVWLRPDGQRLKPTPLFKMVSGHDYLDYQITPGDFLAILRKAAR